MRTVGFLIPCLFFVHLHALASPMDTAQLERHTERIQQQFTILDKALEKGDKRIICREGYKVLDLFYEIDPRVDLPPEALNAYADTSASMNRLIAALKSIPCVPRDPARNKFRY